MPFSQFLSFFHEILHHSPNILRKTLIWSIILGAVALAGDRQNEASGPLLPEERMMRFRAAKYLISHSKSPGVCHRREQIFRSEGNLQKHLASANLCEGRMRKETLPYFNFLILRFSISFQYLKFSMERGSESSWKFCAEPSKACQASILVLACMAPFWLTIPGQKGFWKSSGSTLIGGREIFEVNFRRNCPQTQLAIATSVFNVLSCHR